MSSTYKTIQGDTWDNIAFKVYGKESLMVNLIQANIELADTSIFSANVSIFLPEIETEEYSDLPPWKV